MNHAPPGTFSWWFIAIGEWISLEGCRIETHNESRWSLWLSRKGKRSSFSKMAPTEVWIFPFWNDHFFYFEFIRMAMNEVDKIDHQVVVIIIFYLINQKTNKLHWQMVLKNCKCIWKIGNCPSKKKHSLLYLHIKQIDFQSSRGDYCWTFNTVSCVYDR